jgi:hypothetical protein
MFWKTHARVQSAVSRALSLEEISWVNTLEGAAGSVLTAEVSVSPKETLASASVWVTAPSSPTGSAWTTAPSSPEWLKSTALPALTAKEMKKLARLARNRRSAKVSRERRIARELEMEARVAEIEEVNKALRAQIELELERNAGLKESIGMDLEVGE